MISKKSYNCLYVAITRTGSEAVRSHLKRSGVGTHWNKNQPHPNIPWLHTGHYSAQEWKEVLGEDFNKRFKFTIVRSPWDKLMSHYTGACKYKQFGLKTGYRERPDKFNEWLKMMLTEHIVSPCHPKNGPRSEFCSHERTPHWNCVDWISDHNGNIMVDFIGRYENYVEDYKKALNLVEQHSGKLIPEIPLTRVNTSSAGHDYWFYYNDESVELVRKHFKKDIEEFGYEY